MVSLKTSVRGLRVISQEPRLYFPGDAGDRKSTLPGMCGAAERPWQQRGLPRPPSLHTDEETEAHKRGGFIEVVQ